MAVSGNAVDFRLVGRILSYARPHRTYFFWSIFLTISLALVSPLRPYLVEYTLDHDILQGNYTGLVQMTALMFIILGLQSVIQYSHTYLTNILGQSVIKDMRTETFDHILSLRLQFFDKTPLGQLITRTISDLETIADVFSEGLIEIVGSMLQILALLVFMFITDWTLTLMVLTPVPLLIIGTIYFQKAIKKAFQSVRLEVAQLNTFLQEHITGVRIIQAFSREDQEMGKFKTINRRYRDSNISSNLYYSIFFPFVEIIMALSTGLLVWYGSKRIIHSEIAPGVVVSFIMYISLLFRPIRELADKFNTLQMGMVSAERIFALLDTNEKTPDNGSLAPEILKGTIEFDKVWFAYNEDQFVLKNITFSVNEGETVALVGATGAGKSSTINILNRFYEINSGSIKLDGVDIKEYDLSYLRSKITTVMQDVFLFSDTILNNINLRNADISEERILAAARDVGAEDFINRLPAGIHYNVMERGSTLSAGQAQLLSFIRALVYDPKILVLDEATSSVDTETEGMIQQAILKLMKGRTSIVIAHRLSTIQHADKIIVLEHGEIMEMGTHQELLKSDGHYKRLYDLQFNSAGLNV